jgi:hypothetical protein
MSSQAQSLQQKPKEKTYQMIDEKRILANGEIMPFQMVLEPPVSLLAVAVVVAATSCGEAEAEDATVAAAADDDDDDDDDDGLVPPQVLSARASGDMKGSIGSPPQSAATSPIGTFPPSPL